MNLAFSGHIVDGLWLWTRTLAVIHGLEPQNVQRNSMLLYLLCLYYQTLSNHFIISFSDRTFQNKFWQLQGNLATREGQWFIYTNKICFCFCLLLNKGIVFGNRTSIFSCCLVKCVAHIYTVKCSIVIYNYLTIIISDLYSPIHPEWLYSQAYIKKGCTPV